MSVFACLGAESGAIRDAFVHRLKSHVEVCVCGGVTVNSRLPSPPPFPYTVFTQFSIRSQGFYLLKLIDRPGF